MSDTIFALSSGRPPAGIAVVRVSGPKAGRALDHLAGGRPAARKASLRTLRHPGDGMVLDQALVLWFPGPATATGEDIAEFHIHAGRAVIQALEAALGGLEGFRAAAPGEFTRRAFANGVLDLGQAEALGDLLESETEGQRRAALAMMQGQFSRQIEAWQTRLLHLSAMAEAAIDFDDEADVPEAQVAEWHAAMREIQADMDALRARPSAERLKDGVHVVLAGPPNAGKSTLLNALVAREAAIVSPIAGTTRDVIEANVSLCGVPFRFSDTAGLRAESDDMIEGIGMDRARAMLAVADLVLWLGAPEDAPQVSNMIQIYAQVDRCSAPAGEGLAVSAVTGEGMDRLVDLLVTRARELLPAEGEFALNRRQRDGLAEAAQIMGEGAALSDPLLVAEHLRAALRVFDQLTGRAGTEHMLDALFGRFCVGK